jgi:hypothetical protein
MPCPNAGEVCVGRPGVLKTNAASSDLQNRRNPEKGEACPHDGYMKHQLGCENLGGAPGDMSAATYASGNSTPTDVLPFALTRPFLV